MTDNVRPFLFITLVASVILYSTACRPAKRPTTSKQQKTNTQAGKATKNSEEKKNAEAVEDDLICAITLQLPNDPVIAEDGRIYERSAIEDHIKSRKGRELKSPVTHEKMGEKLLPAPQIKNAIETLINTGVIVDDLAKNWKEKDIQKKKMDDLIKEAENGNRLSMYNVGYRYLYGKDGFQENYKQAFVWFEKSHSAGYIPGTCCVAFMLLDGTGTNKNVPLGMMNLSIAAEKGSDVAASLLGIALADGNYGLGVHRSGAIKWLKIALGGECKFNHLNEHGEKEAKEKLQELQDSVP